MTFDPKRLARVLRSKLRAYSGESKQASFVRLMEIPSLDALTQLLAVSFYASLQSEESRPSQFRLIFMPPNEEEGEQGIFIRRARFITLERPREFSVAEMRRLAPAADLTRLMICVYPGNDSQLNIWGLLDTGDNWYRFLRHEVDGGYVPPARLTVSCVTRGFLELSTNGMAIAQFSEGELKVRGSTVLSSLSPLWKGPISDFFEPSRDELYRSVLSKLEIDKWDEDNKDEDACQRSYTRLLESIISYMEDLRHGASLILVPSYFEAHDDRLLDRCNLKYTCDYDFAWSALIEKLVNHWKFYDLHFPLWNSATIRREQFTRHSILEGELDESSQHLVDIARAIASLSSVDGAVVMTSKLRVLGFGGEILAHSPSLHEVMVQDTNGRFYPVSVNEFGTRHRSMFRFCSSYENSVGFVMSQDGGAKVIKRVGPHVHLQYMPGRSALAH